MGKGYILIHSVKREPFYDKQDELEFTAGVNAITGELNAGKTKWLQMIDYLFGDDGKPELAFDEELVEKYDNISADIEISGERYIVKRTWKEPGKKSKVIINDETYSSKEFSGFILNLLEIPIISVPTGNPYSDRTWPQLSFRELFRHMYKQEALWSDIAQKQVAVTRSAVILQYLNKAKELYSEQYAELVATTRQIEKLVAQKAVFTDILNDVTQEIVRDPNMTVAVTKDSIDKSKANIQLNISKLEDEKKEIFAEEDEKNFDSEEFDTVDEIRSSIEHFIEEKERLEEEKSSLIKRQSELVVYQERLGEEVARFERAEVAATVFSDLKVTHCPSCDQAVNPKRYNFPQCNVCGQNKHEISTIGSGKSRVDFERKQIAEELEELAVLIRELTADINSISNKILDVNGKINTENLKLRASNEYFVRGLPPAISTVNVQIGQLAEKLEQLSRVEQSLKTKEKYNKEISDLEKDIKRLEGEVAENKPEVNFSQLSDLIADKMNTYINAVNLDRLSKWKTGRVSINLTQKDLKILLDGQPWTVKAGGTKNYIIQLAYHYALFSLSNMDQYNYPGFLIIDFPPNFSNAEDIKGSENYLLEPFVDFCKKEGMEKAQVIIAGRSFDNINGANLIHF